MAWAAAAASMFGDLAGSFFGASSADKANKTNIKLARENREWSERMSNTAIQRKVADLTRAGGNPALAFTEGQSASTPSVASPTVDPTFRPEWTKGSTAAALALRTDLDLKKAQTGNISADTRLKTVNANLIESIEGPKSAAQLEGMQKDNALFDQRLEKAINDARISAATADLLEGKKDAAIKLIKSQATLGELDADSATNIAHMLGVTGKDAQGVAKLILEIAKFIITGGNR